MLFGKRHFLLELTDYEVRLVQVSGFGHGYRVEAVAHEAPGDEGAINRALYALSGSGSSSRNRVRVALHPRSAYFLLASLDSSQLVKSSAELSGFPRDHLRLDDVPYLSQIIHPGSGKAYKPNSTQREWFFAGAKASAFEDFNARIDAAGAKVVGAELAPIATIGGVMDYMRMRQIAGGLLTVFLGVETSQVFVTTRDRLVATRTLPIGVKGLIVACQQAFELSGEAEARAILFAGGAAIAERSILIIERLQREIETFAGFYELQAGQGITSLCIIPPFSSLEWVGAGVSHGMGTPLFKPDYAAWLEAQGASWDPGLDIQHLGATWLPTFSLIAQYSTHGSTSTSI